jgi:hypothetical protein
MLRRYVQITVASVVLGMTVVGCSSVKTGSGSHASTTSNAAVSGAPSSAAPNGSTSSVSSLPVAVSSASTSRASTPLCTSDIRVIPGINQGAAGHIALVLVFNNVSRTTTCEIIGYPGVDLVTPSGATVVHLTRTLRGMAGGEPAGVTEPQPVILAPGASASALAEASDVPQAGIADCGSYALLITVPNQYTSVSGGTAMLPRCGAQIHPVVPGTTGGMG